MTLLERKDCADRHEAGRDLSLQWHRPYELQVEDAVERLADKGWDEFGRTPALRSGKTRDPHNIDFGLGLRAQDLDARDIEYRKLGARFRLYGRSHNCRAAAALIIR